MDNFKMRLPNLTLVYRVHWTSKGTMKISENQNNSLVILCKN